ncbi:MAG: peptidylprolyl isomerase, partial [Sulfurimicrobium sp.]|nr:peptidylprolyl isomerase [Sulfurimicrobium sp.]
MKLLRLFTLIFGLALSIGAHAANPMVEMKTNLGSFTLELYPDKAPKTVENFLRYAKGGFYKAT